KSRSNRHTITERSRRKGTCYLDHLWRHERSDALSCSRRIGKNHSNERSHTGNEKSLRYANTNLLIQVVLYENDRHSCLNIVRVFFSIERKNKKRYERGCKVEKMMLCLFYIRNGLLLCGRQNQNSARC